MSCLPPISTRTDTLFPYSTLTRSHRKHHHHARAGRAGVTETPMARFFIDRPIFAWVIAIIIMLAGALSIFTLPVSMYPTVAPPSVEIRATYPGASAKVVAASVTQIGRASCRERVGQYV